MGNGKETSSILQASARVAAGLKNGRQNGVTTRLFPYRSHPYLPIGAIRTLGSVEQ
jgi:hypothetical protein